MKEKIFYITTPIYYPNDRPHIGHAYTTVLADTLARWYRLRGFDVFFLTGTDEHGLKIQREAEKHGLNPRSFVDKMVSIFKEYWSILDIDYSRFIRTTDEDHEEVVKYALDYIYRKGYVYKGIYKGWYCTSCERYYSEKEYIVENGRPTCPSHRKPLEYMEEETYFLKLSEFQDYVLDVLNKDIVYPRHYAQEIISKIKLEGLQDISIARPKTRVYWGIEIPFDKNFTTYVWFDALLNYVSGIEFLRNRDRFDRYWNYVHHVIGKDILWFHTAVWFAMLAMLDIPPPRKLLVHAFLTVKGQKMGKSVGNIVSIDDLMSRYGSSDAVRYILMRVLNYDKDVEVSWDLFDSIYTGDLVNTYGNLVRRLTVLAMRTLNGVVDRDLDEEFVKEIKPLIDQGIEAYNSFRISDAIKYAMDIARKTNAYLNKREPWRSSNPRPTIYTGLEALRITTLLLYPVMPRTATSIIRALGLEIEFSEEIFELGRVDTFRVREAPIPFKKLSGAAGGI